MIVIVLNGIFVPSSVLCINNEILTTDLLNYKTEVVEAIIFFITNTVFPIPWCTFAAIRTYRSLFYFLIEGCPRKKKNHPSSKMDFGVMLKKSLVDFHHVIAGY